MSTDSVGLISEGEAALADHVGQRGEVHEMATGQGLVDQNYFLMHNPQAANQMGALANRVNRQSAVGLLSRSPRQSSAGCE